MNDLKLAILGGGNLGTSIAQGLAASDSIDPANICVTRRNVERISYLSELGMQTTGNNVEAVRNSEVIIMAVKPKHLPGLLSEIKDELDAGRHMVVSTITGVTLREIQQEIGGTIPLFRAMPNTATSVRESITTLASKNATEEQKNTAKAIFDQVGLSLIIDEELFQAATVLGACGIAYALRFIRGMSQGGIEIGFDSKTAQFIATQTLKGAAEILLQTDAHPESEIDKVTTPQGCTIAGLNEMEHRGFSSSLIRGIVTSYESISEMKGK